ncbi:bile acid:sodium symporter family protein [Vibrio methylphosphonaticus]|uniref:bile acid:sodium symporter family protein n=1 Tax=Vibrio methylphosphonaticus TaxID=2946866 RepID=UPI00202A18F6|nr:bile acid:sodium symporter family protein [Vibrio methylphosphonaticus]MCL9774189.1 bile acid:sodium symporter family protein [Vibrio methylphosphonaticus]
MLAKIITLFPLWAILCSIIAFVMPAPFASQSPMIVPLLTVIMLAMGLTLKPSDFLAAIKNKKAVGLGLVLQFTVMPTAALLISLILSFSPELTLGMVLVGTVAGGTSSNVMCYLAKGDVALSITMTALSTFLGVILTPFIIELIMGQSVDIPVLGMIQSLFKIVFLPVSIGVLCNVFFNKAVSKVEPLLPLISMIAIILVVAIVVALTGSKLAAVGPIVMLAVIMHNGFGLTAGYFISKAMGFEEKVCRTIAFEVGLQNSGLATALALKFFTPASAVAGSLFSVWHNISGSIVAGYFSKRSPKEPSLLKVSD